MRLGDALFLFHIRVMRYGVLSLHSVRVYRLRPVYAMSLLVVVFTKRAQIPFSS